MNQQVKKTFLFVIAGSGQQSPHPSLRAPTRNPFNIGEASGIPGQARDDRCARDDRYARDDGKRTIFLNLLTLYFFLKSDPLFFLTFIFVLIKIIRISLQGGKCMQKEKGKLNIDSENIMPIIKKWLYSDEDIFVREMVSNCTDAITKLSALASLGEAPGVTMDEKYAVRVILDKENKTITFEDNGIGMTVEEIRQYINNIAFSGASDFLEKYKDKVDKKNEIIGHFGLGFYSAFMVAEKVRIDSLSYKEGEEAAQWISDGSNEYEMSTGNRQVRGTEITLFISEESKDYLDEYKLRSVLKKYCNFIPVDIYLENAEDKGKEEQEKESGEEEKEPEAPKPINNTAPLWIKKPNECGDDDYKQFYHEVFTDFNDPLFWIHLNMDYPFRLKGILYFPRLKHELETVEGQVKLYNNQVFVADNIKEVIPEFLLLLKGVLDCPDLPLNVSRSFLQNDGYVKKMSSYITKKVADKLNSLFKKERETFEGYWEDISPFIKYGCMREKDFYDKVKDSLIFKTTEGKHKTLKELTEDNKVNSTAEEAKEEEKDERTTVFYVTNEQQQAQYIRMFKDQGMEAVILPSNLDQAFISYLEMYDGSVHFNRIDSDLSEVLKGDGGQEDDAINEQLEKLFQERLGNDKLKIKTESLKDNDVSAVILLSEQSRRMQDMSKMYGGFGGMPAFENEETLVLNKNNSLIKGLISLKDQEDRHNDVDLICRHVYDLAMMSHKPLDAGSMAQFIQRSNQILERMM